jgi:argininosuccinate lyase|nr:argininosuccinate lyase [Kofleriaceae bacterium]
MTIAKTAAAGGPVLLPEVLAFTSSLALDRALMREDVAGSLAHLAMLAAVGIVPAADARALAAGLGKIADGEVALPDEEDVHMAIEAALASTVGAASELLHSARSRNDQVALALRLHVRERAAALLGELAALVAAMVDRARADAGVTLPSYTHRQRAQPISLAYWWLGHAAAFARDLELVRAVWHGADAMPLGVGAIAGTTLPIDREHVRAALKFSRLTVNGLDTVGDRDFALDWTYACARVGLHASRIATDVVDFTTAEFGFAKLDDAIACGSSMMPQKKNPDVFELVRGKAGPAIGDLVALLTTIKGLPGGYNRDLQEDRAPLLAAGARTRSVVAALALALPRVTFDPARCAAAVAGDYTQATDLAEALVSSGVPFRTAYRLVGQLVRQCVDAGVPLAAASPDAARAIDPRFTAAVLASLDPMTSTSRKRSPGSTGPDAVAAQATALAAVAHDAAAHAAALPRTATLLAELRAAF